MALSEKGIGVLIGDPLDDVDEDRAAKLCSPATFQYLDITRPEAGNPPSKRRK